LKRAVRRLRAKPSASKPLPSSSSEDGSGVDTAVGVPETDPPVRSPFTDRGLFISKKKLPLKPVPPRIEKEPVQNVPAGPGQISFRVVLKIWGPANTQTKSPPPGRNASRSNNPPTLLGWKPRDASEVKPGNVGEENVTSMEFAKFATPKDKLKHGGVEDDEHGEGTVNTKVNDAPGAETALVAVSDAYVLVTV